MTVPVLVLTAVLGAPQQPVSQPPAPPATPVFTARFDAEPAQQRPDQRERNSSDERPHQVGVGGVVAMSNQGGGAGFRYFMNNRLGVNLYMGMAKNGPRYSTSNGTVQGSTFYVMPSAIFMLTTPDPTRDVDIRPYVGGGLNYVHATQPGYYTPGNANLSTTSDNGMGGQVFFGMEMTFRSADFITISAEGQYYKLPVNYVNASVMDGFSYGLAFHFYLK
jgi:outer membrane protein W